jgi:hypothetical protein
MGGLFCFCIFVPNKPIALMKNVNLEHVIGLSVQDCECIPLPLPSADIDATTSLSGLYLSETEGLSLKLADAGRDCGVGSVWEMMNTARKNAVLHLQTDIVARLSDIYSQAREPYIGTLGTLAYRGRVEEGEEGFTIKRRDLLGTTFTIDRVGAIVNYDGEVRISFQAVETDPESGTDTVVTKSFVVVCAAYTPTLQILPKAVRIPMNGEAFVVNLELAEGGQALSNSIPCGCGLRDTILAKYFDGFPSSAGGVILEGAITCDPLSIIQRGYNTNANIALVLAFALQYKAAELLLEAVLASGEINRFTMISREHLWGKRDHYRLEYTTRLDYLTGVNGFDVSGSCYARKVDNTNRMRKGAILQ